MLNNRPFVDFKHRLGIILFAILFVLIQQKPVFAAMANRQSVSVIYTYSEPMNFKVFVPPQLTSGERVPVLYLLHGQGQTETVWLQFGLIEKLNTLIAKGRIDPVIIVMPREENYLEAMDQSDFGDRILSELIPFINKNFPVKTERANTGIGGISRGAVWAEKLAFESYEIFGVLGMHSIPSAWSSEYRRFSLKRDYMGVLPFIKIRIDIGIDDQYRKGAEGLVNQLSNADYPYEFQLNSGTHSSEYWEENLESYLVWYGEKLNPKAQKLSLSKRRMAEER